MQVDNLRKKLTSIVDAKQPNLKFYALSDKNIKELNISDELNDSLIELFRSSISDMFLDDEYRLKPISEINDEAANTFYYFQNESIHADLDLLQRFDTQKSDILELTQNTLANIQTLFIKLSGDGESVVLYKKKYPINLLKRGRTIFLTKSSEYIDELKDDILRIDRSFQFLAIGDTVIVANLKTLEKDMGYDKAIREQAQKIIKTIASLEFLADMTKLEQMANTPKIAKKINQIKNSPVIDVVKKDKNKIKKIIDEIDELKKSLNFDSEGKLELTSKTGVEKFLKLLNDDYLKSELTEVVYNSLNKENLK